MEQGSNGYTYIINAIPAVQATMEKITIPPIMAHNIRCLVLFVIYWLNWMFVNWLIG